MTEKVYSYEGKLYCEKDLSMEYDNYGGDLFDLYWDASHGGDRNELGESTVYFSASAPDEVYESAEELVKDYFEDCVIMEVPS